MLTRQDITDQEFVFLFAQKIMIAQVFDARGCGPTSFKEAAKSAGFLFGMANPCSKGGHRLFTRSGHCIQCDTSKIAFTRRFHDAGFVYLAATVKGQLYKVGSTSEVDGRSSSLNADGGYAGFADWVMIAHVKTPNMGRVEFEIHKTLQDQSVQMNYLKTGTTQAAREIIRTDLATLWKAYRNETSKIPQADSWRHSKLSTFDFSKR